MYLCTLFRLQFGEVFKAMDTSKPSEGSQDNNPVYVAVKTLKANKGGVNEEQKDTLMAEVCIVRFCLKCHLKSRHEHRLCWLPCRLHIAVIYSSQYHPIMRIYTNLRIALPCFEYVNDALLRNEKLSAELCVPWYEFCVHLVVYYSSQATITAQFDHPNIVSLVGVVTAGTPLMIVLEVCHNGAVVWSVTVLSDVEHAEQTIASF